MAKRINLFFAFLFAFILFMNVNFISAEYGVNKIQGNGVTISNVNLTALNNTYYINGSNINASTTNFTCSGTDKVTSFNYSNFTGAFNVGCSADLNTASEVLWSANYTLFNSTWSSIYNATYNDAWKYVTNGTFYPIGNPSGFFNLSDFDIADYYPLVNPYSYYNSTTLPSAETLWNANFSLYNLSWSSTFNQTYQDAWKYVTNNSFYPYTSNPFGYLNTSTTYNSLSNFTNDLGFYNSTSWNNPYTYWNSTFATFNKTYADTIYYPYLSNPFGYVNTTSEALWSANLTAHNATWNAMINTSYVPFLGAGANVDLGAFDLTAHNLYAGYLGGTVGSLDMSADPWILAANLTPATTLRQNIGSGPARWNIIYVSNVSTDYVDASHEIYASGNITAGNYFVGSGAFLTDLPLGSEVDPFWSGNSTLVYLKTNPYSFYNSTTWDNPYAYYNTTSWNNPFGYWNSTYALFNKTYADTLYSPITEPLWSGNYSLYNASWATTYNATYDAYNSTGLIINWSLVAITESDPFWSRNLTANNATWNQDLWNTTEQIWAVVYNSTFALINEPLWTDNFTKYNSTWSSIVNDSYYLKTNPYSFYNSTSWNNPFNYTNFTKLSDYTNDLTFYVDNSHSYWNSTYALFNKTYADTLYSTKAEPLWSANLTANNATWNSDLWNTTEQIWAVVYNGTFYADNAHNYTNKTLLSQFQNDGVFITWVNAINGTLALNSSLSLNYFNYTNKTLLSQFGNDLSFYLDNTHSYFNLTNFPNYANVYLNTTNQYNYTNKTLVSQFENDAGYINWANAINGTLALNSSLLGYYPIVNPYSFYNSTTLPQEPPEVDPLWSANYTLFNSTWSSVYNSTYNDAWQYVINGTFYLDNSHSYWNSTFATFNKTYADTLYYGITNPYGFYNSTSPPTETLWNANYSTFLTHIDWSKVINGTIWSQVLNGTVYLSSNSYSFYNSTSWNNPYSYYNSTSPPTETLWNANYSTFLSHITWDKVINGTIWAQVLNGTVMKQTTFDTNWSTFVHEPRWTANLTANNATWNSFANNYSTYLANYTLVLGNFTTLLSKISWDKVINGTIWAQVLNGTVMKQTTFDTNWSTFVHEPRWTANLTVINATMRLMSNQTFYGNVNINSGGSLNMSAGNITVPRDNYICLNGATCSQYIKANVTGVYIQG